MNRPIAWTDMSALPAQADRRQATQDPKLVERLVSWMTARIERRRAAELERLGWDLEARFERRGVASAQHEHHVVLPPGGGLF